MCARNTDTANVETKGYCWYKSTNGIKRHLLVEVLGNPYFVHCTKASVSDDDGLVTILRENKEYLLYQLQRESQFYSTMGITRSI